jgi:hypothetical protein
MALPPNNFESKLSQLNTNLVRQSQLQEQLHNPNLPDTEIDKIATELQQIGIQIRNIRQNLGNSPNNPPITKE